jgi:glycerol 3-phosphatase-2
MLWSRYDGIILDLDGVVYIGDNAVAHAVESLNSLSVPIVAATNNASRTPIEVAQHLNALGLAITARNVITSAQAAAQLLVEQLGTGHRVLAVGGVGVEIALVEAGFHVVRATHNHDANDAIASDVVAVVQGHGTESSWWDFATAAWAINRGKMWIATNIDATVPLPWGLGPGNGSFVMALEHATHQVPLVAGKPQSSLFLTAQQLHNLQRPLVVGDRLDTDIDGAIAAEMDSLLVLTGVHRSHDALMRPRDSQPTYIGEDLRVLTLAQPPSRVTG